MHWIKINKNPADQPENGTYRDWKPLLAEEASNQCVYCAIHEASMGGIRNFHVEHYRPKSRFPDLINDFGNLFYSCPICNTFKSSDWPNDPSPDNSVISYPNPSEIDYNEIFDINPDHGTISGNNVAARYVQEKIYLNRPQLIIERRINSILIQTEDALGETRELLEKIPEDSLYREFSNEYQNLIAQYIDLIKRLRVTPRYTPEDVQRQ